MKGLLVVKTGINNLRQIIFLDGTGMGDQGFIIETNAPVKLLRELEEISNNAYINHPEHADEYIPIWKEKLMDQGYEFKCIDDSGCRASAAYWAETTHENIKEKYVIENQP